jgi:hypothetical protein
LLLPLAPLGQVTGRQQDQPAVPRVRSWRQLRFAVERITDHLPVVPGDVQRELLVQLLLPLPGNALGDQEERTFHSPGEQQLAQDQPGLNRLAEPDRVAEHRREREPLDHRLDHPPLVRPRIDRAGRGREQPGPEQLRRVPQELKDDPLPLHLDRSDILRWLLPRRSRTVSTGG